MCSLQVVYTFELGCRKQRSLYLLGGRYNGPVWCEVDVGLSRILLCVCYKTKWDYPGYSYVSAIRQNGISQDTLMCVL